MLKVRNEEHLTAKNEWGDQKLAYERQINTIKSDCRENIMKMKTECDQNVAEATAKMLVAESAADGNLEKDSFRESDLLSRIENHQNHIDTLQSFNRNLEERLETQGNLFNRHVNNLASTQDAVINMLSMEAPNGLLWDAMIRFPSLRYLPAWKHMREEWEEEYGHEYTQKETEPADPKEAATNTNMVEAGDRMEE